MESKEDTDYTFDGQIMVKIELDDEEFDQTAETSKIQTGKMLYLF